MNVNTKTVSVNGKTGPRLIAFYLTQFHPTPENDLWWGKGFTEWTNVTKAAPLFPGHDQPHLPSDLGFYDLRLRETRIEQIEMAKAYGIDGFCYHYYWFSGQRILNKPLDAMLADPTHDMPFCLCWANENWTRRWNGADQEVLIAQKYRDKDDVNFIESLVPFFRDPRYITVDGAPLLIVYYPQHLPNARKTVGAWRDYCRSIGIDALHVVAALVHGNEDYEKYGCDAAVEFPPHNAKTANINTVVNFNDPFYGNVMQYHTVAQAYLDRSYTQKKVFRTVFPSWDNTARRETRASVMINATPDNYEYWLSETIRRATQNPEGHHRFVFINAWNEWAEGCHLEPDQRHGRKFLEATRRAKEGLSPLEGFPLMAIPKQSIADRRSFREDLARIVHCHIARFVGGLKIRINRVPWARRVALTLVSGVSRLFDIPSR